MNAGMFGQDQSPVGLYVEDRRKLHEADTRGGATNFHMKPNGVFWIGDGVAGVTETSRYLASTPPTRYATQSGPMLIIDGKIYPKIRPDGTSQKIRNGVGACKGGAVSFAIAEEPVTFDTFARLFRDGLGCQNALFLDGSVSSLYAPELNRGDELEPLGPIVGVVERGKYDAKEPIAKCRERVMTGNDVLSIRDACREDAVAACEVIRRSIAELCAADHGDDPEIGAVAQQQYCRETSAHGSPGRRNRRSLRSKLMGLSLSGNGHRRRRRSC